MKIIILNSSPRKNGNTTKLCDAFCEGVAATATRPEITTIFLNELNFKGCQSCFACKLRGSKRYGRCSLNDDLTPVLTAVSDADCIVVASPIYRRMVKKLCLCIEIAEAEDEEFCIVDAMQFSPESLYFGVD